MATMELLYEFIEEPHKAARAVRVSPPVALGIVAYLLTALSLFLSQALAGKSLLFGFTTFSLAWACLWRIGAGFVLSAAVHTMAESLGGQGRVLSLFVLFGFSELAWALALPGLLLLKAFAPGMGFAGTVWLMLVAGVVLALKARSIRHNYSLTAAKAWLALLLPYVLAVFLAFLIFSMALFGAVYQLIKLFS